MTQDSRRRLVSRTKVVQIRRESTSKRVPAMPFNACRVECWTNDATQHVVETQWLPCRARKNPFVASRTLPMFLQSVSD